MVKHLFPAIRRERMRGAAALLVAIVVGFASAVFAMEARADAVPSRVLIDQNMPSAALGHDLPVTLYLPPDYDRLAREGRLPMLILLHGVNGVGKDWVQKGHLQEAADDAIAEGRLPPIVIAMPSSGNSWYVNSKAIGGPGDYETAVGDELPAWLSSRWHAREDAKGRAIAGYSMGGFGAMHLALLHPERWAAVGALSGTFLTLAAAQGLVPLYNHGIFSGSFGWPFNQARLIAASPMTLALNLHHQQAPAVFLTCGRDDFFHLARELTAMSLRLQDRGIKVTAALTKGGHDWETWRAALPDLFTFMGQALRQPAPATPGPSQLVAETKPAPMLAKTPQVKVQTVKSADADAGLTKPSAGATRTTSVEPSLLTAPSGPAVSTVAAPDVKEAPESATDPQAVAR